MASIAYQAWKKGDFKLFPGEPKRDFVYIDDIIDANIHAMDNWVCGIFEVGSGKAETFESLVIFYLTYSPELFSCSQISTRVISTRLFVFF